MLYDDILIFVKEYLRLDLNYTEEDFLLSTLISAACIYLKNATGKDVDLTNELHCQGVALLVANSYENRLPMGKGDRLAYSLDAILFQMQWGM